MAGICGVAGKVAVCILMVVFCLGIPFYFMEKLRYAGVYDENERKNEIMKASGNLIFYLSLKDREYYWYGDYEEFCSRKGECIHLENISHPDDFPVILQQMADTSRGIVYNTHARLKNKEGCYCVFNCRIVPVGEKGKKNRNIVGFFKKVNA